MIKRVHVPFALFKFAKKPLKLSSITSLSSRYSAFSIFSVWLSIYLSLSVFVSLFFLSLTVSVSLFNSRSQAVIH